MVIQSEFAFWVIAAGSFLSAVVILLAGSFWAVAGFIVLRDRGHGTIRSALAILCAMIAVPGVVLWAGIRALPDGPSPPTDLGPVLLVAASAVVVAVVGVLCWAVARIMPRVARRDGGPQRRLRYRLWGLLAGWATLPLGVFLWVEDSWSEAIRAPLVTVPVMYALFVLEARAKNRIDSDRDLGVFVLSLRGFADDLKLTIRADPEETRWAQTGNRNWVNLEQFLADAVQTGIGRMIAFGSPRDKLPGGGAGRIYAPEDGWRKKVEELAVASRAIVMQIGASKSLSDELAIINRRGLAPKLFVLTGPADRSSRVILGFYRFFSRLTGWPEPTWSGFAELLRRNDFDAGAGDPGPGAVITFTTNRTRIDVRNGCRTPQDFATAIAERLDTRPSM